MERIIPARAGFTARPLKRGTQRGDHPRSRGVYRQLIGAPADEPGSSPLARGLRLCIDTNHEAVGIIPARAGFTVLAEAWIDSHGDHPRSRGVYTMRPPPCSPRGGSSPLARGLPCPSSPSTSTRRIIPARAGFTTACAPPNRTPRDHPRSRGVYNNPRTISVRGLGSSPLARGLHQFL